MDNNVFELAKKAYKVIKQELIFVSVCCCIISLFLLFASYDLIELKLNAASPSFILFIVFMLVFLFSVLSLIKGIKVFGRALENKTYKHHVVQIQSYKKVHKMFDAKFVYDGRKYTVSIPTKEIHNIHVFDCEGMVMYIPEEVNV